MRSIFSIILLLLLIIISDVEAQSLEPSTDSNARSIKVIQDAYGKTIAYECANKNIKIGVVIKKSYKHNHKGGSDTTQLVTEEEVMDTSAVVTIMYVKAGDRIADANGTELGHYNVSTKEFKDVNAHKIFSLNARNEIISAAGITLGYIEDDGDVYEINGNKLGNGTDIEPYKLAYYFFYTNR